MFIIGRAAVALMRSAGGAAEKEAREEFEARKAAVEAGISAGFEAVGSPRRLGPLIPPGSSWYLGITIGSG